MSEHDANSLADIAGFTSLLVNVVIQEQEAGIDIITRAGTSTVNFHDGGEKCYRVLFLLAFCRDVF